MKWLMSKMMIFTISNQLIDEITHLIRKRKLNLKFILPLQRQTGTTSSR